MLLAGEADQVARRRGDVVMPSSTTRFGYQPALDGVRALAVGAVVVFHDGSGWLTGGYVGVSVFFTLSGFLITALALAERDRTQRFAVAEFYSRRLRRLLPASLLCLALVVVFAAAGQFDGVGDLRGDVWAALGQVFNWFSLAGEETYADQVAAFLGERSPLDHYWSLAIEEQFYWLWPLVLVAVLRLGRAARALAIAAVTVGAALITVVISAAWGEQATYLATPARVAEILAGATLAAVLAAGRGADTVLTQRCAGWLSAAALVAMAAVAVSWPASGGPGYRGGFLAVALVSVALIAGLQRPSPVRAVLGWTPLVWIGRISYGIYLFHWPVFALVDEDTGLAPLPLLALRVGVTLAVSAVSFVLVERPVRRTTMPLRRVASFGVAASALVAVGAAGLLRTDTPPDELTAGDRATASIPPVDSGESADGELAPLDRRPLRVVVIGDSVAVSIGDGLIRYALDAPDELQVTSAAGIGCGLDPTSIPLDDAFGAPCAEIGSRLPALVARTRPDVVLAAVTFRDTAPRSWTVDEGVLEFDDPRYAEHLEAGYVELTERLLAEGAGHVVWVIPPTPEVFHNPEPMALYRQVVRALPERFGSTVSVIDLDAWMVAQPSPPARSDGLHFSATGGYELAERFLVGELVAVATGRRP